MCSHFADFAGLFSLFQHKRHVVSSQLCPKLITVSNDTSSIINYVQKYAGNNEEKKKHCYVQQ